MLPGWAQACCRNQMISLHWLQSSDWFTDPQTCPSRWKVPCWVPTLAVSCQFSSARGPEMEDSLLGTPPLDSGGRSQGMGHHCPFAPLGLMNSSTADSKAASCLPENCTAENFAFHKNMTLPFLLYFWPRCICTICWIAQISTSPNQSYLWRIREEILPFAMLPILSYSFLPQPFYLFIYC